MRTINTSNILLVIMDGEDKITKIKRSSLVTLLEVITIIVLLAGWYGFWFTR